MLWMGKAGRVTVVERPFERIRVVDCAFTVERAERTRRMGREVRRVIFEWV